MPPPLSLFLAWGTTLDWSCRLVRHLFFESELYWVSAERDAWSRPLVRRLASGTAPLLCDSAARSATHDRARFKPLSLLHIANPPWLCGVWRSGTLGRARLHAVASLERRRCHCDSAGTPTLDLARLCAVSSLERRRCCCDSAGSTTSSRSLRISDDASPGVNSMTGRSRGPILQRFSPLFPRHRPALRWTTRREAVGHRSQHLGLASSTWPAAGAACPSPTPSVSPARPYSAGTVTGG